MKKIEAIIRHERLQDVQDALDQLGVSGLTVSEVVGCGRQKGYTEQYRGQVAIFSLLPKIKVESVVPSDLVEHGMWGYPEQFMPVPGSEYHTPAGPGQRPTPRPVPVGLTAGGDGR